jgi:2-polyprenyl-6-methoxyphenol hydroxylase-like FAD-dependent oxidoreductase
MKLDGRVLIAGAGIGGLTLAVALRAAGFECEIFEREAELRAAGAGILVQTSGMLALRTLGLADAVAAAGREVKTGWAKTERGAALQRTSLALLAEEFEVPTIAIHRARLQEVLLRACEGIPLHRGAPVERYEEEAGRVVAVLESGRSETGALLVGADGLRSAVRQQLVGETPLRYAGYTSWRGIAATEAGVAAGEVAEMMGRGARFGFAAIAPGEVYWFAVLNAPEAGRDHDPPLAVVKRHFGAFAAPVPALLDATPSERILRTDIHDRRPIRTWTSSRVALLGDAAHPTTPNLGQGGCMAIEDAVTLAHSLKTSDSLSGALSTYERARVVKTSRIVEASHRFGKLAQLENPLGAWLRNALLRLTPASVVLKQLREGAGFSLDESGR